MPCVFCEIVARREPANIHYEDDDVIVIDNRMRWTPVMMLVMPKKHLSREEMWGGFMDRIGPVAVKVGEEHCPNGFRLLSNFGRDAMQSQEHGHVHVLGGFYLGPYA